MASYFKYPISDVHIHAWNMDFARQTLDMADKLGYERFVMLSACSIGLEAPGNNLVCAWLKLKRPNSCFAFAAVHYPETGAPSAEDMLFQVASYHAMGFDGIKMMDGKPDMRKRISTPLNDPSFDPMFSFMESEDIPLLYHVNDPWEFWHYDKMPEWAKAMGDRVFYGNGKFESKEQIENEALDILRKHPNLRVIFPHFFFTANSIEHTRQIFEKFPNMCYDITPGWEMFESFAENYSEWRQFFIDYSHRIFFGTDTISDHWEDTTACLRKAMETEEEFVAFEENCKGLNLPENTLRQIYKGNFDRYLPNPPRKMNIDTLLAYGESLYPRAENLKSNSAQRAKASIDEAMLALRELKK